MHIWGFVVLHPITLPVGDQLMMGIGIVSQYTAVVYGAVLKPSVEDYMFLFEHL